VKLFLIASRFHYKLPLNVAPFFSHAWLWHDEYLKWQVLSVFNASQQQQHFSYCLITLLCYMATLGKMNYFVRSCMFAM